MNRLKAPFILLAFILSVDLAYAQSCRDIFEKQPNFQILVQKTSVTQTEILKAAERDLIGDPTVSIQAKNWARNSFALLNLKSNLSRQAKIEAKRRKYEHSFNDLDIPIHPDLRFLLSKYKPYLQSIFALGANGAVNYLTYKYFSSIGYLIYIPQIRFFNSREVPDAVLAELIFADKYNDAPKTRNYIFSEIKFGAQKVYEAVRAVAYAGIFSIFIVSHSDLISDPTGHVYHEMDNTSLAINRMSLENAQQTIQLLEAKKRSLIASQKLDDAVKIDVKIKNLKALCSEIAGQLK